MAILNYTTSVEAGASVAQIIALLSRKGAQSITQDFYEDGRVRAVAFVMKVGVVPVRFVLPANTEGVLAVLQRDQPYNSYRQCTRDQYAMKQRQQAERVAWRILKDWIEAQMALIESGQAEPAQIFMPYATDRTGQTMFQLWMENTQKSLPAEVA